MRSSENTRVLVILGSCAAVIYFMASKPVEACKVSHNNAIADYVLDRHSATASRSHKTTRATASGVSPIAADSVR